MPLKHSTETLLVFVLAAAIALTGFIIAILPPLPGGSPAWGTAFIVSLIYPLALYPLLKSSRADYPFRALHFAPAVMLVLWLLLQIGSTYVPLFAALLAVYTWGWTAIAVLVGIALLAWFCFSVIRQWTQRLGILAAILVPFLALGLVGEKFDWSQRITASLSTGWNSVASRSSSSSSAMSGSSSSTSSTIVAMASSSSISSSGYDRSAYRRRLHILDLGSKPSTSSSSSSSSRVSSMMSSSSSSKVVAMASSMSSSSRSSMSSTSTSSSSAQPGFFSRFLAFFWGPATSSSSSSAMSGSSSSKMVAMSSSSSLHSVIAMVSSSSSTSMSSARSSVSSKPQRLPQTGFGMGEAALILSAGYCGLLHARARRARQA